MVDQLDLFETSVRVDEEFLQKQHDKKYSEKKLTPKEWELYRLVYHNSMVEGRKTTQREICDTIPDFKWNDDITAHDHCTAIWTAIKNNNESGMHEKIIISHNFEYWIGSHEEEKVFLDKLWSDLLPRLKRYWNYSQKIKQDGQGKLLSCQGNPITDESKAREFIESFNPEGVSEWETK